MTRAAHTREDNVSSLKDGKFHWVSYVIIAAPGKGVVTF